MDVFGAIWLPKVTFNRVGFGGKGLLEPAERPTLEGPVRLNCVAMVGYKQVRRRGPVLLAFLVLAGSGTFAQNGQGSQGNPSGQDSQTIQIQSAEQPQNQNNSNTKPLPLKPGYQKAWLARSNLVLRLVLSQRSAH